MHSMITTEYIGISHSDLPRGGVKDAVNWAHCSLHAVQCSQMVHSIKIYFSIFKWKLLRNDSSS